MVAYQITKSCAAIGMGWNHQARVDDAYTLVDTCKERASDLSICCFAFPQSKKESPLALALSKKYQLPIRWIAKSQLQKNQFLCQNFSSKVQGYKGVPSVCEAAALACLRGEKSLLVPKRILGNVTCAMAQGEEF